MTSPDSAVRRRAPRGRLGTAGVYLTLVIAAVLTLAPFAFSVLTALTSPGQFAREGALSLPAPPTLQNLTEVLGGGHGLGRALGVTVAMTGVILVLQLSFSIMAAYAFARIQFPGRAALFWLYLSGLMVPSVVLVVPLYLMMVESGLRNTFWGLVLPFMFASPYAIFLLREYFRGIPQDLIDAARLDGAGHFRIMTGIVVPLSRPIIATLALITVVTQWNSFLWPLVVTTGDTWGVITVATASLQSQHTSNWTLVMAATTLAVVPLLVLFLIFQKQIVRSITITGFK
ncbi:carbohydrate ABC transporter membrane protein 2, CUT1 family [Paramicrobacterium humi]|uniref:Carbohydrate ABC transporter membrane protein 2, CUT1 family n=1 Tax=Paramicrobacterium humi TaxID=640635 RepID=A0A1H4LL92_9MICO|nr:carbohydrate ABC transporter permease [Microbacterium humi]SEB71411.1 carbohydrate ABC transporter membrane protein 2, CUT1 family [Microbacterium humi]